MGTDASFRTIIQLTMAGSTPRPFPPPRFPHQRKKSHFNTLSEWVLHGELVQNRREPAAPVLETPLVLESVRNDQEWKRDEECGEAGGGKGWRGAPISNLHDRRGRLKNSNLCGFLLLT